MQLSSYYSGLASDDRLLRIAKEPEQREVLIGKLDQARTLTIIIAWLEMLVIFIGLLMHANINLFIVTLFGVLILHVQTDSKIKMLKLFASLAQNTENPSARTSG